MGIAGFVGLVAIGCFFRTFVSLFQFLKWRKCEVIEGRLGPFIRYEEEEKTINRFYTFYIQTGTETFTTEYKLTTSKSDSPKLKEGDAVVVYFNPQKKQYREKEDMVSSLWVYPLVCLVCTGIFIICMIIANS